MIVLSGPKRLRIEARGGHNQLAFRASDRGYPAVRFTFMEENMKSRLLAFPLVVLGAIVLVSACTVSAGPLICTADSGACGSDADCCSGVCAPDGSCGVTTCALDGDPCNVDSDCCNAEFCDSGACSVCVSSGNQCNVDSDCCSAVCDSDGFCG